MTCIAGIARGGKVWMGCDSAAAEDDDLTIIRESKMVKRGEILVGLAGSARLANLVAHVLEFPARKGRTTDMHYLCGPFADALSKCFVAHAPHLEAETAKEDGMSFTALVGYRGALYYLGSELDVTRTSDDFEACGSGASVARGALYATQKLAPKASILRALSAAERYKTGVRRPFRVVTL